MARKRQIDPGIWTSEQFCNLSSCARLLWIGMISNADDEGRLKGSAQYLKMIIFPGDAHTAKDLTKWKEEIVTQKLVQSYNANGSEYLYLPTFKQHQYMTKKFDSKLPTPPVDNELITDTQQGINELHGIGNGNDIGIGNEDGRVFPEWLKLLETLHPFKVENDWINDIESRFADIDLEEAAREFVDYWSERKKEIKSMKATFRNRLKGCQQWGKCLKPKSSKCALDNLL